MSRKFRVKVGGKILEVEVEEIKEEKRSAAPVHTPVVPPKPAEPSRPAEPYITTVEMGVIRAPLPGKVVAIRRKEGDRVKAGDAIVLLESMKMDNAISAPKDGVVAPR